MVSNGHGEDAIAARIAAELSRLAQVEVDHLALVGDIAPPFPMCPVGPRRAMPSGGLIAMANLRNLVADIGSGLIAHTLRQLRFLRASRKKYDAVLAVGDVFALLMSLVAQCLTLYVGTAKSIYVASYGALERRALKRAARVFVRDEPTAAFLRSRGVEAQAVGNVIADFAPTVLTHAAGEGDEILALFPGSRAAAYCDAVFLARILRNVAAVRTGVRGRLSIAPGLHAPTFAHMLRADGWAIKPSPSAEVAFEGVAGERFLLEAWAGEFSALLQDATLVLGQAGTANEAAAAAGVPIVAFEDAKGKGGAWYRMRQARLLGAALRVASRDLSKATAAVVELLDDGARRQHMGEVGRQRMGPPGGALRIARQVVDLVQHAAR